MPVNGWQTIHGLAGILSESEETDQLRHQMRIKRVSDVGNFTAMAPINMCTQIVWFRLNKHLRAAAPAADPGSNYYLAEKAGLWIYMSSLWDTGP